MRSLVKVIHRDGRSLLLRWIDPVTGRWRERTTGTNNRRAADRLAAELALSIDRGEFAPAGDLPWAAFRERYAEEHLSGLSRRSQEAANTVLNHFERLMRPKLLSDAADASALSGFQSKLRAGGIKETSVCSYMGQFLAALGWAEDIGAIHEVPKLRKPKRVKTGKSFSRGRPISGEEFDRMLEAAPHVRSGDYPAWQRYLTGLWLSGLRLEESLALTWEHRDDGISVDLSGRHPRLKICAAAEKGNKDRYLPMTPDFAEFLLKTSEHERCGLVFPLVARKAEQMSVKRVSRNVSDIGRRAKVVVSKRDNKFATAHDLRRSFGTRWSTRVKPAVLQLLMRHDSIETTLKYYVAHDADDIADGLWKEFGPADKAASELGDA
jgi:integrase